MKKQIACMHAFYTEATDKSKNDHILYKLRVREQDGSESVLMKSMENFKREFFVTKKGYRNTHKQKKEFEALENLDSYVSTQAMLPIEAGKRLGIHKPYVDMGAVTSSPYLYGTDISTTSLLKKQYQDRYPGFQPDATVAALDLETNVFSEREEIIYGCVTFKDRALLCVNLEWLGDVPNYEERLQQLFDVHLAEHKKNRNMKLHVVGCKNDLVVVKRLFQFLHKYKPDFVSIWNMVFDVEKIIDCIKHYGHNPADYFCDPMVPKVYRKYYWKKDRAQKTTATGKTTSKHYADLWHILDAPASFYIIDSMCFFKINRVREEARHSYSLNAILDEVLDLKKLKFEEDQHLEGLEWHQYMQREWKLRYGIYNVFDCIALELLDEATHDISKAVLGGLGVTDPKNLTSGPKNLANDIHFFLRERGKVVCSTAPSMEDPLDALTIGMKDWIAILTSELALPSPRQFIQDLCGARPRLYTHIFDIDIESGYPTTGDIMNISKRTTLREVCGIGDLPESEQRRAGINMTAIRTNAIELGQTLYGLPTMEEMLKRFKHTLPES